MNEYVKQARDFLKESNAKMVIKFIGFTSPRWDKENLHATYKIKIKTEKGQIELDFYDSLKNTELLYYSQLSYFDDPFGRYQRKYKSLIPYRDFEEKIKKGKPTEYDILACLTKYDPGRMDDFFSEFGFEINCAQDMFDFIETYNACVKEYNDLCRMFTEEQMEKLREIW